MRRRVIIPATAAAIVLAGGIGAGVALSGGGDDEGTVTGPAADRARAAALAHEPGGTATAVERDGENGATWEVEIRRADGTSIDVRLDERYQVVVTEPDTEAPDSPER